MSNQQLEFARDAEVQTGLLRVMAEHSNELALAVTADGSVLFGSPALERAYGFASGEMVGMNLAEFIHPDDLADMLAGLDAVSSDVNNLPRLKAVRVRVPGNGWRWIEASSIVQLDNPKPGTMLFQVRDVTDELERAQARLAAERVEQEQRAFAAALVDAAALLSRAPDYEAMLDGILETMARIVPYDTASIMTREGDSLVIARARGFDKYGLEDWITTVSFPLDTSKFLRLAERGEPLVMSNVQNDPDWIPIPESAWIQSHLSVPIMQGQEAMGLLSLDSATPGFFRAEDGERLVPFAGLVSAALQNARLLQRAERRAREFQELYQTTRDLSVIFESTQLLETIVDHAIALLDAPFGSVNVHNPATGMLEQVVTRGNNRPLAHSVRMGEGLLGQVAQTREPLVVNEYPSWAARTEAGIKLGVQAAVAVPITYRNNLFGVLGVAHTKPGKRIEPSQVTLLTLFAGQAAAALETARLLSETRQRAEQLSMLYDIGLTLNRSLDPRTQLLFMFNIARRALHADRMAFFQYDTVEDVLRYQAGIGTPERVEAQIRDMSFGLHNPTTLVGWVARERLPARIPDTQVDERWVSSESNLRAALAVPVEHEQALRGVLLASSETVDAFSPQDERLLVLCGNQIAAAMELARLFSAQERRHSEMQILREASLKFAATRERDQLVPLILECAIGLVAADDALLYWHDGGKLTPAGILQASHNGTPSPLSQAPPSGVTLAAARTGQMALVDEHNRVEMSDVEWDGATLALPLHRGEQVLAVLTMVFAHPHRFDRDEVRALSLLADQATVALENARHYVESQAQLRDAQLLHRAGEALNRTLSVFDTANQLASYFMEALRVDACCISQVDQARDAIQVVYDHDPIAELRLAPGTSDRLSNLTHLRRALAERRTVMYRRDALDLASDSATYMDAYHWRSLLVLPLFEGEEVIGLVELVDRQEFRDFAPDEVRLAESLAHQAASALRNARLYEEMRRRAQELAWLNEFALNVSGAHTLDELLDIIEVQALPLLPWDCYAIGLCETASDYINFRRVMHAGVRRAPYQWKLSPSLTRRVVTTGEALSVPDRQDFDSPDNPPKIYGNDATPRSWLGAPLRVDNAVVGVITLQAFRTAAFDQSSQDLLQTIADQVAVAVARLRRTENGKV